jgi:ATP-dependent Clp protease ATP-binding subunit ClpA
MAAGEFKQIEPEHFCMALLKFAELPAGAIKADDKNVEIAEAVAADVELVREALEKCGIESTRARRKLRGQLGKGGTPRQDGQIHRSAASRALFESATQNWRRSSGATWSLRSTSSPRWSSLPPQPSPRRCLARPHLRPHRRPCRCSINTGRTLVKEASEGKLKPDSSVQASSKAVIQILLRKDRKSVLLVTDNDALIAAHCRGDCDSP